MSTVFFELFFILAKGRPFPQHYKRKNGRKTLHPLIFAMPDIISLIPITCRIKHSDRRAVNEEKQKRKNKTDNGNNKTRNGNAGRHACGSCLFHGNCGKVDSGNTHQKTYRIYIRNPKQAAAYYSHNKSGYAHTSAGIGNRLLIYRLLVYGLLIYRLLISGRNRLLSRLNGRFGNTCPSVCAEQCPVRYLLAAIFTKHNIPPTFFYSIPLNIKTVNIAEGKTYNKRPVTSKKNALNVNFLFSLQKLLIFLN